MLSPTLFNLFLEEIMSETQNNYLSSISIGGRPIWNLKFVDDIDLIAGSNEEIQELIDQLSRNATRYGMEISSDIHANINLYGEHLEEVDEICYLGATITKDGTCETDIRIRLALATSAIVRLYTIWNSKQIQFMLKYNLYRTLVLSILTYGCETWTINAVMNKKIQAFENISHRKLLGIEYTE